MFASPYFLALAYELLANMKRKAFPDPSPSAKYTHTHTSQQYMTSTSVFEAIVKK